MITRQGTTFFGLSTDDPKPSNAKNGSCFIEMDTGAIYFYDAASETWIEWGGA